uniref:Uncharacterized protein n=1 Tax=Aegilops tauschii subsp. strangulata TaxID=200361 RepID=A0A453BGY7_AEGTS
MCLRPKLLQLDRGSMHPRLEAVVLGDMHVQGEEVDEGLKKQSMPPYRWADQAMRFSGCLTDDGEGRIRSAGYSARKLETLAVDLLYKTCVARGVEPASGKEIDDVREETSLHPLSDSQLFFFFANCLLHIVHV